MKQTASTILVVAVGIGLMAATAVGKEPEGGPLDEPLDEAQLPVTWRNLANERVMFPLDMKDMPVKIGGERQLFLDNYLIAESANVRRQIQRPRRDKRNPILTPFLPEEGSPEYRAIAAHVMQFKTSPRFRMWYQSFPDWHPWRPDEKIRFASSYAVSEDGIHWSKPDLDLHRIKGSGLRNIVIPYGLMHGVFHEPHEPDPQKRFKDRYRRKGEKYIPPVLSYRRRDGVSVTAGYVYRGKRNSSYYGAFIFADFESKRIWAMTQKDRKLVKVRQIGSCPEKPCSFGIDNNGELLVIDYEGTIYRLVLDDSVFE